MKFLRLIKKNCENNPDLKKSMYEKTIVDLIRERYSINQELAILRQRDTKPEEFAEYNAYVEECKQSIKTALDV